jgi:hypothetical protein
MTSERIQQQIDALLNETEAAVRALDWELVRNRAQAVISLDGSNVDALAYLKAAETNLAAAPTARRARTYEYHSVNVRGLTWNIGGKIDSLTAKMSEAGWEFVGQSELAAPSTSGLDRQIELRFRRSRWRGQHLHLWVASRGDASCRWYHRCS